MAIKNYIQESMPIGEQLTAREVLAKAADYAEKINDKEFLNKLEEKGIAWFTCKVISPRLNEKPNGLVALGFVVKVPQTYPQKFVRVRQSTPLLDTAYYRPITGKRTKTPKTHQKRMANLNANYGEQLRQAYPHCACCGIHLPHLHYSQVDHCVSIAKEGKEVIEGNLCLMCMPCNLVKQTKSIETARMEIKKKGVKINFQSAAHAERVHKSITIQMDAGYMID